MENLDEHWQLSHELLWTSSDTYGESAINVAGVHNRAIGYVYLIQFRSLLSALELSCSGAFTFLAKSKKSAAVSRQKKVYLRSSSPFFGHVLMGSALSGTLSFTNLYSMDVSAIYRTYDRRHTIKRGSNAPSLTNIFF